MYEGWKFSPLLLMLKNLHLSQFRCFKDISFELSPGLNLFTGYNGSGKSSIIESLYLAGRGKSFRAQKSNELIHNDFNVSYVHLGFLQHKLSIEISRNTLTYKYRNDILKKRSELLDILPLQLLTPVSHEIVESGPSHRRKFIDWGLFHVEHKYRELFSRFSKTLKQRNELLKSKSNDLSVWNDQFVRLSVDLNYYRKNYLDEISIIFNNIQQSLNKDYELGFSYFSGWTTDNLEKELQQYLAKDKKYGWTTVGPHKADIYFKVNDSRQKLLSRGQQKLFIFVLQLAQCIHLKQTSDLVSPVFLIDDISSELDAINQKLVCDLLKKFKLQSFITNIEQSDLLSESCDKVFHVEH